jgi:hypothetical protein
MAVSRDLAQAVNADGGDRAVTVRVTAQLEVEADTTRRAQREPSGLRQALGFLCPLQDQEGPAEGCSRYFQVGERDSELGRAIAVQITEGQHALAEAFWTNETVIGRTHGDEARADGEARALFEETGGGLPERLAGANAQQFRRLTELS